MLHTQGRVVGESSSRGVVGRRGPKAPNTASPTDCPESTDEGSKPRSRRKWGHTCGSATRGGGFQGPHLQKAKSTPQTVSENTNGAIKHSLPSIVLNRLPGPVRHVFLNSDLIF